MGCIVKLRTSLFIKHGDAYLIKVNDTLRIYQLTSITTASRYYTCNNKIPKTFKTIKKEISN